MDGDRLEVIDNIITPTSKEICVSIGTVQPGRRTLVVVGEVETGVLTIVDDFEVDLSNYDYMLDIGDAYKVYDYLFEYIGERLPGSWERVSSIYVDTTGDRFHLITDSLRKHCPVEKICVNELAEKHGGLGYWMSRESHNELRGRMYENVLARRVMCPLGSSFSYEFWKTMAESGKYAINDLFDAVSVLCIGLEDRV